MTATVLVTETVTKGDVGYLGFCSHSPTSPWSVQQGQRTENGSLHLVREKISEQSGVFIPGVYRVNPYAVKGGMIGVPNDTEGSWNTSEFDEGIDNNLWPGIPESYFNLVADRDNQPWYFVAVPFVYTSTYRPPLYRGYVNGGTYFHTAWLVGDWWRYKLPNWASDDTIPHEAADYEQLSLQKAYSKLGSADLELGESIGEYRETIEMLRRPLSSLRKFLLDDKSRNWRLMTALAAKDKRQVAKLLGRTGLASGDAMASTWLELRYGLRPLVSLIQDVIDRVNAKRGEVFDPDVIRTARSKLTFGPIQNWVDSKYVYSLFEVQSRCLVEDTYTSVASVQYQQDAEESFLDSLGLTPRFLPEVAWELTRLSYVVDWIFSIGPWLGTLRINPGITVLGNTSGFKHERTVRVFKTEMRARSSYANVPFTTIPHAHQEGGDVAIRTETYERKVDVNLEYVPHFTWGRTLDLFKAIDSVSLIWQFCQNLRR